MTDCPQCGAEVEIETEFVFDDRYNLYREVDVTCDNDHLFIYHGRIPVEKTGGSLNLRAAAEHDELPPHERETEPYAGIRPAVGEGDPVSPHSETIEVTLPTAENGQPRKLTAHEAKGLAGGLQACADSIIDSHQFADQDGEDGGNNGH